MGSRSEMKSCLRQHYLFISPACSNLCKLDANKSALPLFFSSDFSFSIMIFPKGELSALRCLEDSLEFCKGSRDV